MTSRGLTNGDPEPVFSIGSIEGGSSPSTAIWRDALRRLTRRVADLRENIDSPLNMNVVFQIPGNLLRPDFEGVRTGHFSKKERLLMVQVALPDEPPEDVDADLKSKLLAAVDEAERWARKRHLAENLIGIRRLVTSL